jgi:hypothetical protein
MKLQYWLVFIVVAVLSACSAVEAPSPAGDGAGGTAIAMLSRSQASPTELLTGFDAPAGATGDVVILYGQVLDPSGKAVPDALVEIWQTDASGVYDHPGDPGTASRDQAFQFFGTAQTDGDGWYAFRTIVPGEYEPRPPHIHYKVKQDGETLLTSQFYFADDVISLDDLAGLPPVTGGDALLNLPLVTDGERLLAPAPIVVSVDGEAGPLPLTPAQMEGPYYPVVELSGYDNDLVRR